MRGVEYDVNVYVGDREMVWIEYSSDREQVWIEYSGYREQVWIDHIGFAIIDIVLICVSKEVVE